VLEYEMRLWSKPRLFAATEGAVLYGENGWMLVTNSSWKAYDDKGKLVREGKGDGAQIQQAHVRNFLDAVRSRKREALNQEIGSGHTSSAMCHAGTNRTVLVTGGSRGIGRACCVRLAQAGARVAINYRAREDAARETARLVESTGGQAMTVAGNVADERSVAEMVERVNERFGPIDMLVNNAGIFEYVTHAQTTLDHWRRTLDVNLTGTYLVTWAVKEEMIARRFGRIVNVSSIAALRARPQAIAYAASKAGVVAFTKSAAEALIPYNIRMNAVAPGLIDTEILEDVDKETLLRIIQETPMKRIGQADEVADVVHFLLSEASRFMMGQTLVASGGRVMLP
jgi:3-oxoacyl-[acyl-carrier protein] reductase